MNTYTLTKAQVLTLGGVAFSIGIAGAFALSASADTTGAVQDMRQHKCDSEQHEAVEAALEDGDYEAWAVLMDGRGRVADVVTEDSFDTFVAMHEAMEDGDVEEAQELREELGLRGRPQDGSGHRGGGMGMKSGAMHRGMGSGDGVPNGWAQ